MKKLPLFIFLMIFPFYLSAQTFCAGDYTLKNSQEALALAGCTAIGGSLTVVGYNVDLSPLASLQNIGGDLIFESDATAGPFTTFSLPALSSIGGQLFFIENPLLKVISLPELRSIGGDLTISSNDALTTLDINDCLFVLGDNCGIANNPLLETCCCAVNSVVGSAIFGVDVRIRDNAPGGSCNSPEDVRDACYEPPICAGEVEVILDANCQAEITENMVLKDVRCSEFTINVFNDADPSNGAIVDGLQDPWSAPIVYIITSLLDPDYNCYGSVVPIDNLPLSLSCPPILEVEDTDRDGKEALTDLAALGVVATDNCGIAKLSISPTTFGLGSTPAEVTAFDESGKSKVCEVQVVVSEPCPAELQESKLLASDGATEDLFGQTVAIHGDWALIGAPGDDNANGTDAGAAYLYHWDSSAWIEQHKYALETNSTSAAPI